MATVKEKSVIEQAQAILAADAPTSEEVKAAISAVQAERGRLVVEAGRLATQPVTTGTPEQIAAARFQQVAASAAAEQAEAIGRELQRKLNATLTVEARRDYVKLQGQFGKTMADVRKQAEALAQAWAAAEAALGRLDGARTLINGNHWAAGERAADDVVEACQLANETLGVEWHGINMPSRALDFDKSILGIG